MDILAISYKSAIKGNYNKFSLPLRGGFGSYYSSRGAPVTYNSYYDKGLLIVDNDYDNISNIIKSVAEQKYDILKLSLDGILSADQETEMRITNVIHTDYPYAILHGMLSVYYHNELIPDDDEFDVAWDKALRQRDEANK